MVRKRSKQQQDLNDFVSAADKPEGALDPKAPRKYKSITVPMNEYEYNKLVAAAEQADRGLLDFIRQSLKASIKKELGS
jgi:hypothetical protein